MMETDGARIRGVRLAKNDFSSVIGSVLQKLRFSVQFQFCKINCGFGFCVSLFCTVYYLMCMHSTQCFPVYCFITLFMV